MSGNDYNNVLSEAAMACNLAQNNGGNRIQYHSELRQEVQEEDQAREMRLQIKDAITHQRLLLAHSPLVGVAIESAELYTLLMRLRNSQGEVLYPSQFLDVANKYKIMPGLDRWTVRTAIQSLSEKQSSEPKTLFFLKLSQPTILDREFSPWLKALLDSYPLQPNSCIFEIKESDLMGNVDQIQAFVTRMHELKCCVTIEHFGLNEDSMEILNLLRPDYLLLDAILLQGMSSDLQKQKSVKNICTLAHREGCKVLTAYIEDPQALAVLWSIGVDFIQGDFLDPPEDIIQE